MRKILGIITVLLSLVYIGCTNPETPKQDKTIHELNVPGIVTPVYGATPVLIPINAIEYTGTIIWSPRAGTYAANTVYTATISLKAKDGWTFEGVAANSFIVGGATSTNKVNSGTITAVFPATGAAPDLTISLLTIPGVVAPVRGATPITTAINTEQYTGTIAWTPTDNPFAASTEYTANIELTAKTGWKLDGILQNGFTVAGATTTNTANTGTVAAVFPATGLPSDINVTFSNMVQAGGVSNAVSSTSLTLSFTIDPTTLDADDISVTGATKGALSGTGTTRSIAISNITVANGATLSVAVASPSGFAIAGSPRTAVVYKAPTPVAFSSAVQAGGTSSSASSTSLTLNFSADPTTLAASDITITGATKGDLSGSGTTRSLAISAIKVVDGATVSVTVASPMGFTITGSPQTAVVYKAIAIGETYQGGKIAYILQSGDPGYDAGATHGLIAAIEDHTTTLIWAIAAYQTTSVTTSYDLGTGQANTNAIVTQNGAGNTYAAGFCNSFTNVDTGTGVYTDWFLPCYDELNILYLNQTAIGNFGANDYWSSTQDDNTYAHSIRFTTGNLYSSLKENNYYIRPVRAF